MSKPILSVTAFVVISVLLVIYISVSLFKLNTARTTKIYILYGSAMSLMVIANILIMSSSKWVLWLSTLLYYSSLILFCVTLIFCNKEKGYDNNKITLFLSYLFISVVAVGITSISGRVMAGLNADVSVDQHGGKLEKFNDTVSSYLYSDSKSPYSLATESSLFS